MFGEHLLLKLYLYHVVAVVVGFVAVLEESNGEL